MHLCSVSLFHIGFYFFPVWQNSDYCMKQRDTKHGKPKAFLGWIFSHKKFAIGIMAILMVAPVSAALVMHWESQDKTTVIGNAATVGFDTNIAGLVTNANQTPLQLSGSNTLYNESNIAQYSANINTHRVGNSTFSLSIYNLLPGDYVGFTVTVKNLGGATLAFGNYSLNDAAYNSTTGAFMPPSENVTGAMNGTNSTYMPIAADTYSGNFGNMVGYTAQQFENSLVGHSYWEFSWGSNTKVIPKDLKPGQSFSYTMYVGLGTTASYPPTQAVFTMDIPLIPAQ